MADSVDRVFGHALTTVNKIRTGARKPPVADRLRLYGLYKQAMEGNVTSVQPRPSASISTSTSTPHAKPHASSSSADLSRDQEKWDAWRSNTGMSRTEAKRQYISTLITTMQRYANDTPASRALVSELEFVWDQIKDNPAVAETSEGRDHNGMRTLSPDSIRDGDDETDIAPGIGSGGGVGDAEDDFHDAPVSQFDDDVETEAQTQDRDQNEAGVRDRAPITPASSSRRSRRQIPGRPESVASGDQPPSLSTTKWRRRIESSLEKVATEIAALREQLEARSYISPSSPAGSSSFLHPRNGRRGMYTSASGGHTGATGWIGRYLAGLLGLVARTSWFLAKIVMVDAFLVILFLLYIRRRRRERLKDALRVILGDARVVALNFAQQVQQVGSKLTTHG